MRHTKRATVAKQGVLKLQEIVNNHGSIYRPVHGEDDVGVDGFIEFVAEESATGHLVAAQVKSGDSYLRTNEACFEIAVSDARLQYWLSYMLPVILVCYSPSKDLMCWTSVRDYVAAEEYHNRPLQNRIRIRHSSVLDEQSMRKLSGLAAARSDERILIRAADKCLSNTPQDRQDGFRILANHPNSRDLRVTCLMAKRLLLDDNISLAKDALYILGYGVGRIRWSCNPNNLQEHDQAGFASEMCSTLSESEIHRCLELCDDEGFHGPHGLGERLFDVMGCCWSQAESVLLRVISDSKQPMDRRINALYLLYGCDDDDIEQSRDELLSDPAFAEVAAAMFAASDSA